MSLYTSKVRESNLCIGLQKYWFYNDKLTRTLSLSWNSGFRRKVNLTRVTHNKFYQFAFSIAPLLPFSITVYCLVQKTTNLIKLYLIQDWVMLFLYLSHLEQQTDFINNYIYKSNFKLIDCFTIPMIVKIFGDPKHSYSQSAMCINECGLYARFWL